MQGALLAGLARMQQIGGAKLGDRTMIDALQPALESLDQGLDVAAYSARKGADHTATILRANAGRAAYVSSDKLFGHKDPGAEAVARLFEALTQG
jgi:triose/dihydroxyacetone kinase / FAD-AMP lyase (cyclizing)